MRQSSICFIMMMLVLLSSCGREGKVIPRDKMARIYAEMFIVDQKINQDRDARRVADTSFVYAPIFEKYGYSVEDYRASMAHYIKDPDRYARILRHSASIIETEIKSLKKEKERLEALEKLHEEVSVYSPERIFRLTGLGNPDLFAEDSLSFFVDSTGGDLYFDTRVWMDTAFYGPVMQIQERDSLSVADSVSMELPEPDVPVKVETGDPLKMLPVQMDKGKAMERRPVAPEDKPHLKPAMDMKIEDKINSAETVKEKK